MSSSVSLELITAQTREIEVNPYPANLQFVQADVIHNPALSYLVSLGSRRSRQTMASYLNRIAKRLGAKGIEDCQWQALRRQHVQALIDWLLDEGKSPATINAYLAAIKGVSLEAWMLKLIDTETFQHIRHVKPVRGVRLPKGRALEEWEVRALINACTQDRSVIGVRDAAILGILAGCGLRRNEVVQIDFEDISFRDGSIRVIGKGNKERESFMPPQVNELVRVWVEEVRGEDPGPLFYRIRRHDDTTGDRLSDQAIYYIIKRRAKEAKLKPVSPHDLRRTFGTNLLDQGVDMSIVMDAMGHANISTTQIYDRRRASRVRAASQLIRW